MEKQQVTTHSWQSMKYRYRVRLAKKQTEVVEAETTAEEAEAADGETKVIKLKSIFSYISVSQILRDGFEVEQSLMNSLLIQHFRSS